MSFMYPRTVAISRPGAQSGAGRLGYGGVSPTTETSVATGLPANIQRSNASGQSVHGLPADAQKTYWSVFLPRQSAALGLVEVRDIVTDDAGIRYQVQAPYWNSMGYNLLCERLET